MRMSRHVFLLGLNFLSVISVCEASTFRVNSTTDSVDINPGNGVCKAAGNVCTLRAAIMEANAWAGTDQINIPNGTYALTIAGAVDDNCQSGDLDITSDLNMNGSTTREPKVVVDAAVIGERALHIVGSTNTVDIEGLQVVNGADDDGGGIKNLGILTLTNVYIQKSAATSRGGGIFSDNNTSLTLDQVTVSSNTAQEDGGGLYLDIDSIVNISDGSINNNSITSVVAGSYGGGIANTGTLNISDSRILANQITSSTTNVGGGGLASSGDLLTLSNTTISDNRISTTSDTALGAGLYIYNGDISLTEVQVTHNSLAVGGSAGYGGGLYLDSAVSGTIESALIEENNVMVNNIGGGSGGIFNVGNIEISRSTISNNSAQAVETVYGGGITNYGTVTVDSSTIAHNSTTGDYVNLGSGIHNARGILYLVNSTISGNSSTGSGSVIGGGGLSNNYTATAYVYSSTITDNNSADVGGGIFVWADGVYLENTILAGNTATGNGKDCSVDTGGTLTSNGNTLIGDIDDCSYTAGAADKTGSTLAGTVIDPLLSLLTNNGGGIETHALQTGSPAIDAGETTGCKDQTGVTLSYDQRGSGYNRTVGGACDMGAYEVQ